MKILLVFGTRPEAIKMAPLVLELRRHAPLQVRVCVTGQHRHMLDQVLAVFGIVPDFDLDVMRPGQDLTGVTTQVLAGLRDVLAQWRPDRVLVHGDTTTTLAASLAAYYARVEVAHVEAGLRTGDIQAPWPEEVNRKVTGAIASHHFAPTAQARDNLLREGVPAQAIDVTGNTVIDALLRAVALIETQPGLRDELDAALPPPAPGRRLLLVTAHRRENFGQGFEDIFRAIRTLGRRPDVQVVFPVHLNPHTQEPARRILSGLGHVHLVEPLDYLPFVRLMSRCHFILSDSGGLQEEAPALGKPVLVLRQATERPEAVRAGTAMLVGSDAQAIVAGAARLLDDPAAHAAMASRHNPYGDGKACERIAARLLAWAGAG